MVKSSRPKTDGDGDTTTLLSKFGKVIPPACLFANAGTDGHGVGWAWVGFYSVPHGAF